jgi:hypothetical protein
MMGTRTGFHARRSPAIALALLLPLSTLAVRAAEVPSPEPLPADNQEQLEELDKVVISGAFGPAGESAVRRIAGELARVPGFTA